MIWQVMSSAVLLVASAGPIQEDNGTAMLRGAEAVASTLVRLEYVGPGEQTTRFAGFLVEATGVIVSCYPPPGATGARVYLSTGETYDQSLVVASDERRGLLVLRVPGHALPAVTFSESGEATPGSIVLVVAASAAGPSNRTIVVAGALATSDSGVLHQALSTELAPAMCGSPVFDADLRVVGALAPSPVADTGRLISLPASTIQGLLAFPAMPEPLADFLAAAREEPSSPALVTESAKTVAPTREPSVLLPEPLYVNVQRDGALVPGRLRATVASLIYEEQMPSDFGFAVPWRDVATMRRSVGSRSLFVAFDRQGSPFGQEAQFLVQEVTKLATFIEFSATRGVRVRTITPEESFDPNEVLPLTPDVTKPVLRTETIKLRLTSEQIIAVGGEARKFTMRFLVNADGTVQEAKLYRIEPNLTMPLLSRSGLHSAIEESAIAYWRFIPAVKAGRTVRVWHTLTVEITPAVRR